MSYPDSSDPYRTDRPPSDNTDRYPSDRDVRSGRHRARRDAAPDAYAPETGQPGQDYGESYSAHPIYGRPAPGGPAPDRRPQYPAADAPFQPPSGAGRPGPPAGPPYPGVRGPGGPGPGGPGGYGPGVPGPGGYGPGGPGPGAHGGADETRRLRAADGTELPPLDLDLTGSRTSRSRQSRRAEAEQTAAARKSRAGRNLPAAIGIGVLLAGIVLGSLFLWRPAFVAVIAIGAAVGVWEMCRALAGAGRANPPLIPLIGGCVVMPVLAWNGGVESLIIGLLLTVVAVMIWRLSGGAAGFQRDMTASTLIAVYVPFLISFGVLLAVPDDGDLRVLAVLACVVFSDTGGYVAGVFLGKHPMAPTVSPKKSWEGLGGSLVATAVGGALFVHYLFDQPWWHGAVLGIGVSAAAVLGDLAESLIKRDLGVKDMSKLLPGHGGLMDRLDSVVFAAPTAFMLLSLLAPVGS